MKVHVREGRKRENTPIGFSVENGSQFYNLSLQMVRGKAWKHILWEACEIINLKPKWAY